MACRSAKKSRSRPSATARSVFAKSSSIIPSGSAKRNFGPGETASAICCSSSGKDSRHECAMNETTGKIRGTVNILAELRQVLDIEIEALRSVRENLDGRFVKAVETLQECQGQIVVTGIGKS